VLMTRTSSVLITSQRCQLDAGLPARLKIACLESQKWKFRISLAYNVPDHVACPEVNTHSGASLPRSPITRRLVHERKRELGWSARVTCVPQDYALGQEGQVDWYEAWAELDGVQVPLQVMARRIPCTPISI
jgi:hypothetical protein